jgi:hypothetical protein
MEMAITEGTTRNKNPPTMGKSIIKNKLLCAHEKDILI